MARTAAADSVCGNVGRVPSVSRDGSSVVDYEEHAPLWGFGAQPLLEDTWESYGDEAAVVFLVRPISDAGGFPL